MQQRLALFVALFATVACSGSNAEPAAGQGQGGSTGAAGAVGSGGASAAAGTASNEGGSGTSASSGGSGGSGLGGSGLGGAGSGVGGQAGAVQGGAPAAGMGGAGMSGSASGASGAAGTSSGGTTAVDLTGKHVLMVGLSTGKATPGDTLMIDRLKGRGLDVTLVADTVVTAAMADGKDLILISSSEESGNLGTKLRDLAIPTLCMEDGSFADMKMASARGHAMATTALDFVGKDALAGGLSGSVTIANAPPAPGEMGWGTAAASAIVAATIVGQPTEAALFAYEKGADMMGMPAPARRVGFAAREDIASHFTEQGLKVFDTAVDWVLSPQ